MVDLHVHTTASDGQYSPHAVIEKARDAGISVIAITDHDTVAGVAEAMEAGAATGVTVIPGMELNISWPKGEFHLLGLGYTHISPSLAELLQSLQRNRAERNYEIIEKMRADGVDVSLELLEEMFPGQTLGRPHIAAFLVEKKIVKTRQAAFDMFLARGKPWYTSRTGANLDEAVVAIGESGGVPVIAHPLSLYLSWGKLSDTLTDIHERGVMGLEAYHSGTTLHDAERLEELARAHGFFVTAASDFHGEAIRKDRKLGHTAGGKKIDDRFWTDNLKPYLSRLHSSG